MSAIYPTQSELLDLWPFLSGPEKDEIAALSQPIGLASSADYADDPAGFGRDVLGETYTDNVKAMMESVCEHTVTIARSGNAVGKTHGAARTAVWFYKTHKDAQVYTAAAPPLSNLQRLLWGEIGGLAVKHPALFKDDSLTTLHIERGPQSFITGVTIPASGSAAQREARFSGKHAPHLLFIIDEGDAVPDEVYRGIESCMSGGHARMLIMFNPRAEAGPVYRMERDRRANVVELSALDHPNVTTGREIIPGAVNRETTVRRIIQWSRPLTEREKPDNECFEVPGFLVDCRATINGQLTAPLAGGWRKITEPALSYMVLAQYPAQGTTQLISRAWIDAARARWDAYVAQYGEIPIEGTKPIAGLDVAEYGVDANALCLRSGGWVAPIETWGGMDVLATADKAAERLRTVGAAGANVDATGVGAGVWPQLQRQGIRAMRIMVASAPTMRTEMGVFGDMRDQLWWATREWLRTDMGAMLPPDELLIEELSTPTYEIRVGKIKVMAKPVMRELLKRSPDRADALALTFAPNRHVLIAGV